MKRFLKHLCVVSKRYYEREQARKKFDVQLKKVTKSPNIDSELALLNRKVSLLLDAEAKVASLGKDKGTPAAVKRRLKIMEEKLSWTESERDLLARQNESLMNALTSAWKMSEGSSDESIEEKLEELKLSSEKDHKEFVIKDMKGKIRLLEDSYQEIRKDKSVSKDRLAAIKNKLESYKETLENL
ncbi:hypothetical protein J4401_01680 [Candidatus Woesearchaeota archaeon]|nr:hypothetical protein [Candidatus Woesearchaeota archaeon]